MTARDGRRAGGAGPDSAAAASVLRERGGVRPRVHLILGSGLDSLAARVGDPVRIPFAELPGYPRPSVEGHAGAFVMGRIAGVPALVQSGRFHSYEGFGAEVVLAPVRTGRAAGAEVVIVTNAAGGIRKDLAPGAAMMIDDHIGAMFGSPLAGPPFHGEERFPDQSRPYDLELMRLAEEAALGAGVRLTRGVYAAVQGPSFETPAEILALQGGGRRRGGDVHGAGGGRGRGRAVSACWPSRRSPTGRRGLGWTRWTTTT